MTNGQTKKCHQCLADIPKNARKCSHCGTKQPSQILKAAAIILGLVVLWTMISNTFSSDESVVNDTYVYTQPASVESDFPLGSYKVESEEFAYIEPKVVNLWQSYSNRKKVGEVREGSVVEVTQQDPENDYCKVTSAGQIGWIACGWLVKIE